MCVHRHHHQELTKKLTFNIKNTRHNDDRGDNEGGGLDWTGDSGQSVTMVEPRDNTANKYRIMNQSSDRGQLIHMTLISDTTIGQTIDQVLLGNRPAQLLPIDVYLWSTD